MVLDATITTGHWEAQSRKYVLGVQIVITMIGMDRCIIHSRVEILKKKWIDQSNRKRWSISRKKKSNSKIKKIHMERVMLRWRNQRQLLQKQKVQKAITVEAAWWCRVKGFTINRCSTCALCRKTSSRCYNLSWNKARKATRTNINSSQTKWLTTHKQECIHLLTHTHRHICNRRWCIHITTGVTTLNSMVCQCSISTAEDAQTQNTHILSLK